MSLSGVPDRARVRVQDFGSINVSLFGNRDGTGKADLCEGSEKQRRKGHKLHGSRKVGIKMERFLN